MEMSMAWKPGVGFWSFLKRSAIPRAAAPRLTQRFALELQLCRATEGERRALLARLVAVSSRKSFVVAAKDRRLWSCERVSLDV